MFLHKIAPFQATAVKDSTLKFASMEDKLSFVKRVGYSVSMVGRYTLGFFFCYHWANLIGKVSPEFIRQRVVVLFVLCNWH